MVVTVENIFQLGRRAAKGLSGTVGYREDGAVSLALGNEEPQCAAELVRLPEKPRFLHYHPVKSDTPEQVEERITELHKRFPNLQIHGLSPAWLERNPGALPSLRKAGLFSISWFTGSVDGAPEAPSQGWQALKSADIPKVATFVYAPGVTRAQVEARVAEILEGNPAVILPLPRGLGDKIMLASATTDGILDVSVLTWTRLACQGHTVRLRASWGALGWKMAQPTLAFGVNELAGWGLEETLAYGPKARPGVLVGVDEVESGIREVGRQPLGVSTCAWDC